MADDVLAPFVGPSVRIANKADLDRFVALPEARDIVRRSSFEQIFFTIKTVGLGDATGLLAWVTPSQTCGFIDLDCWRKDSFVRRPFMEWIAAFVQTGAEETARALGGIDPDVIALFLKDLIDVYEMERDEPPPEGGLTFTPDRSLAVRQRESGAAASISALILDALFRYDPDLGFQILRRVRYATRIDLEETAYQSKMRRLDVHGFVDYYEALSIYAEPQSGETFGKPSGGRTEAIPGDTSPQSLPTVFADSLEGGLLVTALGGVRASDTERLADELTALGNRIISANLVNLGEVENVRVALGEMKDILTIGLETLSGGDAGLASEALGSHHIQSVFRKGFAELERLRNAAESLIRIPGFRPELLESPDVEFLSGLVRFKPLLWTGERFRHFESIGEVEGSFSRVRALSSLVRGLLALFPDARPTLRQTFNTAVVQKAISGRFEPIPIRASELESFLTGGVRFPELDLPDELAPFARDWMESLAGELEPLAGTKIDPRFVDSLHVQL